MTQTRTLALFLLAAASSAAQQPVILPADRPDAITFYTPHSFLQLMGVRRPDEPERLVLCNMTADAPLLARVEWTTPASTPLDHEAFLQPRACSIRTLAPGEQPAGPAALRTTWQHLGPRMEHRPQ